jgi:hypothetical protein
MAVVFRADAAFAKPELYETLEEHNVKYAIRLPGKGLRPQNEYIEELRTFAAEIMAHYR